MGINRWEEQQERADKTGRDPGKMPKDRRKATIPPASGPPKSPPKTGRSRRSWKS